VKTDPKGNDLQPEIGSAKRMKEKAVLLAVSIPFVLALILSFIHDGASGDDSGGKRVFIIIAWVVFILSVQLLIRNNRVFTFKKNRGDYDVDIEAKKNEAELQRKALAELQTKAAKNMADAAERTSTLTSGAVGLLKDASVAATDKLKQRASQCKDARPETGGPIKDDIAGRLEKLSNLHKQGHISQEEFAQQRTRILNEV
jgi:hypothetical protein